MEMHSYRMPRKETLIMPVGDIQWAGDDADVALNMLKRHIQWGIEHDAWFIGMGDYIDAFSPSQRHAIQTAVRYDTAKKVINQTADNLVEQIYNEALRGSEGRWLGLLEGHHFHEFPEGDTSDMRLAKMLKTVHLGTAAYVRLRYEKSDGNWNEVLVWCHHGVGSGTRAGSAATKMELLPAYWDGDIFLMGHHHRKFAVPMDRVVPAWPKVGVQPPRLLHRTVMLVGTGGFLKGYPAQHRIGNIPRGTYVAQRLLPPVALGGVLVKIRPRWKQPSRSEGPRTGYWLPDISAEV